MGHHVAVDRDPVTHDPGGFSRPTGSRLSRPGERDLGPDRLARERTVLRIHVMPMEAEEHAGLGGSPRVLKLVDGKTVGHNEVQLISGLITGPRQVQILDMRYNLLRSQALTPRLSREFIEKLLGET
ncbi:Scr1 family TA system antitoxin-like transcriptional regulator [Streptomyces rubiginosohelvolus]|uniref:Scr1 family TA system antitoxin-like transcriptional regulator n=1 Tax=Streptomyces rubiginosohelvolus TaxID=67362 RepID=UPI0036F9D61C